MKVKSLTVEVSGNEEAQELLNLISGGGETAEETPKKKIVEEEEEETTDEEEEAEETKPPKKGKGPSKDDVIEALQNYSEKHDRKAAMKILKSFKVDSVHKLKESEYSKIIEKLEE